MSGEVCCFCGKVVSEGRGRYIEAASSSTANGQSRKVDLLKYCIGIWLRVGKTKVLFVIYQRETIYVNNVFYYCYAG